MNKEPNCYHVSFSFDDQLYYSTPKVDKMIPIAGAKVVKFIYTNGEQLLHVNHDGQVDVFSTFPIHLERSKEPEES